MSHTEILYIDSQKDYASHLIETLINHNFSVKFCTSINDGFISYSKNKPDLIIIDSHIEGINSFKFLKKLKLKNKDLKIIVLTSSENSEIFLNAIELKIDKLFFKKQALNELENSVKQLLSLKNEQKNEQKNELIHLGNEFYFNENKIIHNNDTISLTSQEIILVTELLKVKGRFVPTLSLQKIISKDGITSIDTLRTVIRRIRKKTYSTIIENKSGIGYKINYYTRNDDVNKFLLEESIRIDIKVLILKGNKKKSDLLKFQLEKLGLQCENCYTLENATTLLEVEPYDYIISDLNLPDGESIDFIRDTNDIKFIILSKEQDIHYKEYLYFKGIIDYITDTDDISYLAYNIYNSIIKVETNTKFNNILVIDKSKRICEQIKDLLQPRNFNVSTLNDLSHAKELIKTKHFSLVLLDMNIENNFDFLYDIKSKIDKSISFIMLTDTNRTYEVVREAYNKGAAESLRKPIFAEEFIIKVGQIIEHSKLIGELIQQKELIESYKTIVDKSAIVSKTDKDGKITYVNDIFCDISGYSREELIGKKHNIIRHPDTSNTLFKELWNCVIKEKKTWHGILKNKKKNNQTYIVQTSIMPILDEENNIMELIALRNDVTNIYKGIK